MDDQDDDDDFAPLSMKGIKLKSVKNEISFSQSSNIRTQRRELRDNLSCSQTSSISRLSKSRRKKFGNRPQSYANSITLTNTTDDLEHFSVTTSVAYCPTCQAPFDSMKINPRVHADQCCVSWVGLEECPLGELCYNDNRFHYQDYAHSVLAQIRASKGHLENNLSSSEANDTFKAPLCKSVKVSNSKKKLFNDSDSVITLSTDISTSSSLNRANNARICDTENKSHNKNLHVPVNMGIEKHCQNEYIKQNQVVYGPEIGNKITDNGRKRRRVEEISHCHINSDFKVLSKKRKIENNKNVQSENFNSSKMDMINQDPRSLLNSQKTNNDVTILDIIDTSENITNSEGGAYIKNDSSLYDSVDQIKHCFVEDCKNCKALASGKSPCKEKELSISEHPEEVRATLSVIVSPTKNSDNAKNNLETPVKVDAICDKSGWKTIGIAAPSTTKVDNVKVAVCNCAKTMEVNCSLSQKQTITDMTNNVDSKGNELELQYFKDVKEPKRFNKLNANNSPKAGDQQMSITSYFRTSKQPSTLCLKSCIEPSGMEDKPCSSSSVQTQQISDVHEITNTADMSKQNKEAAIASWKNILKGMVQKGKSTISVISDDSVATTNSQTSAGTGKTYRNSKKNCPFYKKIPDTTFVVDAFQYGVIPNVTHYFLSHFHFDHYVGLRKSFSCPIYCSKITAALVKMKIGVDEQYIHELELDKPRKIRGVDVTALDANHCPGSVMFLFQLQDGRNFLHVGDFRADPKMEEYPCFWNSTIHKLFLDTTYCEPKYDFPMQSETITRVVELATEHHSKFPRTLFVCGSYTIGKEKVFISIAEALNCKIWASSDKRRVLKCIDHPVVNEKLTDKQLAAQVHVCRMSDLNNAFLQRYLKQHVGVFTHLVAFVPTGWELRPGKNRDSDSINMTSYGNVTIYGVPYSEHSSFTELKRFVQFLKPEEVIPTVSVGSPAKRTAMQKYFREWLSETPITPKINKQVQQKMSNYLQTFRQKNS